MKDTLGIVYTAKKNGDHWYNPAYELPVCGGYRAIDFSLSSLIGSGISSIAVLSDGDGISLFNYLQSESITDYSMGSCEIKMLPCHGVYKKEVISYIKKRREKYLLFCRGDAVYNFDFSKLYRFHINNLPDITVGGTGARTDTGIFIMKRQSFLKNAEAAGRADKSAVLNYEYNNRFTVPDSPAAYKTICMEMLCNDYRYELFAGEHKMFTKTNSYPPSVLTKYSDVKNSVLGDGCIISGKVLDSALFEGVRVQRGARINGSIIMDKCFVGMNCTLINVIVKESCIIKHGVTIKGGENTPLVIEKGEVVTEDIIRG